MRALHFPMSLINSNSWPQFSKIKEKEFPRPKNHCCPRGIKRSPRTEHRYFIFTSGLPLQVMAWKRGAGGGGFFVQRTGVQQPPSEQCTGQVGRRKTAGRRYLYPNKTAVDFLLDRRHGRYQIPIRPVAALSSFAHDIERGRGRGRYLSEEDAGPPGQPVLYFLSAYRLGGNSKRRRGVVLYSTAAATTLLLLMLSIPGGGYICVPGRPRSKEGCPSPDGAFQSTSRIRQDMPSLCPIPLILILLLLSPHTSLLLPENISSSPIQIAPDSRSGEVVGVGPTVRKVLGLGEYLPLLVGGGGRGWYCPSTARFVSRPLRQAGRQSVSQSSAIWQRAPRRYGRPWNRATATASATATATAIAVTV